MARETKIGLLAGLAFIICFAIILANRGRQDLIPGLLALDGDTRSGTVAYHGARSTTSPPGFGSRTAGSGHRVIESPTPRRMRKSVPPRTDRDINSRPRSTQHEARDVTDRAWRDGQPADETPVRTPDGVLETSPVLASADSIDEMRVLERRLDELSRQLRLESRSQERPAQLPMTEDSGPASIPAASRLVRASSVPAELARYTVAAGDTLSAIAARYYGGKARRLADAIFDANRTVLSNPDQLRIGVELIIPAVSGYDRPSGVPSVAPLRENETIRETGTEELPDAGPFRWYQIQKNDRYISIARQQLGDAGRWREIYDLNRDKFPDPGLIREGVRIRLPPLEVADARQGRR